MVLTSWLLGECMSAVQFIVIVKLSLIVLHSRMSAISDWAFPVDASDSSIDPLLTLEGTFTFFSFSFSPVHSLPSFPPVIPYLWNSSNLPSPKATEGLRKHWFSPAGPLRAWLSNAFWLKKISALGVASHNLFSSISPSRFFRGDKVIGISISSYFGRRVPCPEWIDTYGY